MSVLIRLIVLCLASSVVGCGLAKLELTYEITLRNAHTDLPLAGQFAALYPKAEEAITYFPVEHGTSYWRTEVGLYGRYCLSMHIPITISESRIHSSQAGAPEFVLAEVESVEEWPDGRINSTHGKTIVFGLKEWNTIVKSNGDLSSLGIEVIKDKPITNFEKQRC